jgi:lysozyme
VTPELRPYIEQQEGCRLEKYRDVAGYWTIGYGHRCSDTQGPIIQSIADLWLSDDLKLVEKNVLALSPHLSGKRLDAIIDLCFNAGVGAYMKSQLRQEVNCCDWITAAANIRTWDHIHVNGHIIENDDLKRRRAVDAMWLQNG